MRDGVELLTHDESHAVVDCNARERGERNQRQGDKQRQAAGMALVRGKLSAAVHEHLVTSSERPDTSVRSATTGTTRRQTIRRGPSTSLTSIGLKG